MCHQQRGNTRYVRVIFIMIPVRTSRTCSSTLVYEFTCNEEVSILAFPSLTSPTLNRPNMLFPILDADMSMSSRTPPSVIRKDTTVATSLQRGIQNAAKF